MQQPAVLRPIDIAVQYNAALVDKLELQNQVSKSSYKKELADRDRELQNGIGQGLGFNGLGSSAQKSLSSCIEKQERQIILQNTAGQGSDEKPRMQSSAGPDVGSASGSRESRFDSKQVHR